MENTQSQDLTNGNILEATSGQALLHSSACESSDNECCLSDGMLGNFQDETDSTFMNCKVNEIHANASSVYNYKDLRMGARRRKRDTDSEASIASINEILALYSAMKKSRDLELALEEKNYTENGKKGYVVKKGDNDASSNTSNFSDAGKHYEEEELANGVKTKQRLTSQENSQRRTSDMQSIIDALPISDLGEGEYFFLSMI